jgi:hypothetical protein
MYGMGVPYYRKPTQMVMNYSVEVGHKTINSQERERQACITPVTVYLCPATKCGAPELAASP